MNPLDLPAHVAPPYANAIEATFRVLQSELGPSLRGILLAGSVATGTAAAGSDIDLFALAHVSWWQRRRLAVGDIEVDIFVDQVSRIEDELSFGRSAVPISAFATGSSCSRTSSGS